MGGERGRGSERERERNERERERERTSRQQSLGQMSARTRVSRRVCASGNTCCVFMCLSCFLWLSLCQRGMRVSCVWHKTPDECLLGSHRSLRVLVCLLHACAGARVCCPRACARGWVLSGGGVAVVGSGCANLRSNGVLAVCHGSQVKLPSDHCPPL